MVDFKCTLLCFCQIGSPVACRSKINDQANLHRQTELSRQIINVNCTLNACWHARSDTSSFPNSQTVLPKPPSFLDAASSGFPPVAPVASRLPLMKSHAAPSADAGDERGGGRWLGGGGGVLRVVAGSAGFSLPSH